MNESGHMDEGRSAVSKEGVQRWLIDRIAEGTNTDRATIEPTVPVAAYGLDSVLAVTLIFEIEDRYGLALDDDALWEARTIDRLADLIAIWLEASANGG